MCAFEFVLKYKIVHSYEVMLIYHSNSGTNVQEIIQQHHLCCIPDQSLHIALSQKQDVSPIPWSRLSGHVI
mgnify:CR=1 FL=1